MATLTSVFAMEDRVSPTLAKIENSITTAKEKFDLAAQSTGVWTNKIEDTEERLNSMAQQLAAAVNVQNRHDPGFMTKDAFEQLEVQYENLCRQQERNELNLQKAINTQDAAARKAEELDEVYRAKAESERTAAEVALAYADAQSVVADRLDFT